MIEYTERENKAFKMWAEGAPYADIGAVLGITADAAYQLLRQRDHKTLLNARLDFISATITVRTAHTLIRGGIYSRDEMDEAGRDGLRAIKGLGVGTADEIWRAYTEGNQKNELD